VPTTRTLSKSLVLLLQYELVIGVVARICLLSMTDDYVVTLGPEEIFAAFFPKTF
jgi:hypothetical protein